MNKTEVLDILTRGCMVAWLTKRTSLKNGEWMQEHAFQALIDTTRTIVDVVDAFPMLKAAFSQFHDNEGEVIDFADYENYNGVSLILKEMGYAWKSIHEIGGDEGEGEKATRICAMLEIGDPLLAMRTHGLDEVALLNAIAGHTLWQYDGTRQYDGTYASYQGCPFEYSTLFRVWPTTTSNVFFSSVPDPDKPKPVVALDGDGVVFCYETGYLNVWERVFGERPVMINPLGKTMETKYALKHLENDEWDKFRENFGDEFWSTLPILPGAESAIRRLAQYVDITMVTAIPYSAINARRQNLAHLPVKGLIATPVPNGWVAGRDPSPKVEAVRSTGAIAFVDDHIGFLQGIDKHVERVYISETPGDDGHYDVVHPSLESWVNTFLRENFNA